MLHAPTSTSNVVTFLETGTLPIENEIHVRQLTFLHHIINLQDDDPVKTTYCQQLKYPYEPNWANTVVALRRKYGIGERDDEIVEISKERWKGIVKAKVFRYLWKPGVYIFRNPPTRPRPHGNSIWFLRNRVKNRAFL